MKLMIQGEMLSEHELLVTPCVHSLPELKMPLIAPLHDKLSKASSAPTILGKKVQLW